MKKLLLILTVVLGFGFISNAQRKGFIQAGVSTSSNTFTQDLEVGSKSAKNIVSVVAQTYEMGERQWFLGGKYTKLLNVGNGISLAPSAAVKIRLNEDSGDLVFEPGLAVNLPIGKAVNVQVAVSTPISENTNLFKPISLRSGLGLNVTL
jgi:hypothetical protein